MRGTLLALAASAGSIGTLLATQGTSDLERQGSSVYIGAPNRYEAQYGKPQFFTLEILVSPFGGEQVQIPLNQSIRTLGTSSVLPRPKSEPPQCRLCTGDMRYCLDLTNPVVEIRDAFFIEAPFRNNHEMEIVGAFTDEGFVFWSFSSAPPREKAAGSGWVSLESLVRRPDRFQGRTIAVRGRFRGRNLFGDMPADSQRGPSDWVLRDGPFFIWVTGKAPKGSGFALDLASHSDSAYRLEVEGLPEVRGGLVYLRAREVRLLGRGDHPTN